MSVLFDGEIHVHYGFVFLGSGGSDLPRGLERGEPLPPPFDQPPRAYARVLCGGDDTATFTTAFRIADLDETPPPLAPEAAAVDGMLGAANTERPGGDQGGRRRGRWAGRPHCASRRGPAVHPATI